MGKKAISDEFAENFSGLADRYREICIRLFGGKHVEFAQKCGINKTSLSKIVNENTAPKIPGIDTFRVLLTLPEINARWLLFGQGAMIEGDKIYSRDGMLITYEQPQAAVSSGDTPEYNSLLDKYTALAIENGRLKERLGEKVSRGLASA